MSYIKLYNILKWNIKKAIHFIIEKIYLLYPFWLCKKIFFKKKIENSNLDIYVIAFNNLKAIELLHNKMKLYLKDPYVLIIVDNSNSTVVSNHLYAFAKKYTINYLKLPAQPFFKLSSSHGLALNWVYMNLIKRREGQYFGFIDHDVFPVSRVNLISKLSNQLFYGVRHYAVSNFNRNIWDSNSPSFWYLWPGFAFFNYELVKNIKFDFMPKVINGHIFDTGGGLFQEFYANPKYNSDDITFVKWDRIYSQRGKVVDVFDEKWIHTLNGSNWRGLDVDENEMEKIIEEFEYRNTAENQV